MLDDAGESGAQLGEQQMAEQRNDLLAAQERKKKRKDEASKAR